jgi:hypothetical protein
LSPRRHFDSPLAGRSDACYRTIFFEHVGNNVEGRAKSVGRVCLGGSGMKLRKILICAATAIGAAGLAAGCGSKSTVNAVTVTVSSSLGPTIIVGQATTLTATVTGGTTTNTAVNWQPCQFTTTTVSGTTTTTSTPATCPTDGSLGTLSNQQTTGTATYTAPGQIPDQTKFPGLQIIITAQSQQDTKKT